MPSVDKGLVSDLQTLVGPRSPAAGAQARLPTVAARGALGKQRGVGKEAGVSPLDGSGTAGPFTEGATGAAASFQRTYHPLQIIKSSDNVLALEYEPLKTIKFLDGNGDEVTFNFSIPPAT